ncbi:cache domain-containing sensor histidine kinase [Gorillibacterium sp. sgz5001074]|uniref:cache domain-containing sensor histidine kinase n=1 Tax=Gorillibacterium sp. sgz5001074 TaxID=3446695 RepID=UPI003F66CF37
MRLSDISKLSFRNKLKVAFLTVTILSILITGSLAYGITASILEKNAMNLTQDTVVTSARIVDEKLNKLMLVMMTFMISQPFHDMLKDVANGETSRYYTHLNNLDNVFSQARMAEPLIDSIFISTPMGEFYPLTLNRNRQQSFFDTPLYERVLREKRNVWVEGHEDQLFSGKHRVVSLILEPIYDVPIRDVYVVVNIREEGLHKLVSPETGNDGGSSRLLLGRDAKPVYDAQDELAARALGSGQLARLIEGGSSGNDSYVLDSRTYLLNYAHLATADWTMVAVQSKDYVLRDMIYIKWMMLWITAGCFLVTSAVSGGFTTYLLRPLQALLLVMKRVEGNDLTVRYASRNQDELSQVGFRFNRMLDQIVLLIDEVKMAETTKRAAEIKSLSAQMDPHFLYNTLNTIYWKLKLKQVDPSQKMVVALSRLFQLGLNKGNEITTLKKELEHVRQYLELQTYSYENLFEYEISVQQEELLQLSLPRIMLQPLVENSILHGFRSMESGGRIEIEAGMDQERKVCVIRVTDNGRGMEAGPLQALVRADGHEQSGGYAIGNLNSRLQLYYGGKAGLTMESVPDEGTTVRIRIPLKGVPSDE